MEQTPITLAGFLKKRLALDNQCLFRRSRIPWFLNMLLYLTIYLHWSLCNTFQPGCGMTWCMVVMGGEAAARDVIVFFSESFLSRRGLTP